MSKLKKIFAGLGVALALGVATVPLSAYATGTQNQTVVVTIDEAVYLAIGGQETDTMGAGETDTTTLASLILAGATGPYTLTVNADTATDVNLTNSGGAMITGSATVATPGVGTGSPFAGGSYTWGIGSAANAGGACTDVASCVTTPAAWASTTLVAPTTTATQIGTAGGNGGGITAPTADAFVVRYGVTTSTNQPSGDYSGTNIFTIVAN